MEKGLFGDIVEWDYVAIKVEGLNCQDGILRSVAGIGLVARVIG
jgi:hypothetical protein